MLSCFLVDEEETNVDDTDESNVTLARYSLRLQKYRRQKNHIHKYKYTTVVFALFSQISRMAFAMMEAATTMLRLENLGMNFTSLGL